MAEITIRPIETWPDGWRTDKDLAVEVDDQGPVPGARDLDCDAGTQRVPVAHLVTAGVLALNVDLGFLRDGVLLDKGEQVAHGERLRFGRLGHRLTVAQHHQRQIYEGEA